jgi:hypothetical protein
LDGLFPELLGSPKAPALVKLASLKNLIWTGLKFRRPCGTEFGNKVLRHTDGLLDCDRVTPQDY